MFLAVADLLRHLRWAERRQQPVADVPTRPVLAPGDDGPDPDNAERARRLEAKQQRVHRPEDHPNAGRHERLAARIPATPPPVADGCPGCAGRDHVIRELQDERKQLRARLAAFQLATTREQRLGSPIQLP